MLIFVNIESKYSVIMLSILTKLLKYQRMNLPQHTRKAQSLK